MNTLNTELKTLTAINLDAGEVFSGKPSGTTVTGYDKPCAYTPQIDQDYILHDASRDIIVWFLSKA